MSECSNESREDSSLEDEDIILAAEIVCSSEESLFEGGEGEDDGEEAPLVDSMVLPAVSLTRHPLANIIQSENERSVPLIERQAKYQWMKRNIPTLIFGYLSNTPILPDFNSFERNTNRSGMDRDGGPNITLTLMAREWTGGRRNNMGGASRLRAMGGLTLFTTFDVLSKGVCTETSRLKRTFEYVFLQETRNSILSRNTRENDLDTICSLVSSISTKIAPPKYSQDSLGIISSPSTEKELENVRFGFVQSHGIPLFQDIFVKFHGSLTCYGNSNMGKQSNCIKQILVALKEVTIQFPHVIQDGTMTNFLPKLFMFLANQDCFEETISLIEEILLVMQSISTMFFLENVPDLHTIWNSFTPLQLAQFCRVLALLIYESYDYNNRYFVPKSSSHENENTQNPLSISSSLALLELRRDFVPNKVIQKNQMILVKDKKLIKKLCKLLIICCYAPSLHQEKQYELFNKYAWISDILIVLGFSNIQDWDSIHAIDTLAKARCSEVPYDIPLHSLGSISDMLLSLSSSFFSQDTNQDTGLILQMINAAHEAGVGIGMQNNHNRAVPSPHNTVTPNEISPSLGNLTLNSSSTSPPPAAVALPLVETGIVTAVSLADTPDDVLFAGIPFAEAEAIPISNDQAQNHDDRDVIHVITNYADDIDGVIYDEDDDYEYQSDIEDSDNMEEASTFLYTPPLSSSQQDTNNAASRASTTHLNYSSSEAANQLQFNALRILPFLLEILFVFQQLLIADHINKDLHLFLLKEGFIDILHNLFFQLSLDHMNSDVENEQDLLDLDNTQVVSNSLVHSSVKVQYLRLIHSFAQLSIHFQHRRSFYSSDELLKLSDFFKTDATTPSNQGTSRIIRNKGLLSNLINVFISQKDNCAWKYWTAISIEALIKFSSIKEHNFILSRNSSLLSYIIEENVLSHKLHCAGNLQLHFDLLGELCRSNIQTVQMLVKNFLSNDSDFERFMIIVIENLVDSNVFLRSLFVCIMELDLASKVSKAQIQSVSDYGKELCSNCEPSTVMEKELRNFSHKIENLSTIEDQDSKQSCAKTNSCGNGSHGIGINEISHLCSFLKTNYVLIIRDLLCTISLATIDNNNICCLNTAIIIAIFAQRRSELSNLVQDLRFMNDKKAYTYQSYSLVQPFTMKRNVKDIPINYLTRNFRELLWFWSEYYNSKNEECNLLESCSNISFHEWRLVVDLLCKDDGSGTSLLENTNTITLPRSPYSRPVRVSLKFV